MDYNRQTCIHVIALTIVILLCQSSQLLAQSDLCDPVFSQLSKDFLSYQDRGDRCEGHYVPSVQVKTFSIFHLASFIESFESGDSKSQQPLEVEWTVPKDNKVNLRAYGLRPGLYYRMDTTRPAGEKSYRWPVDILQALSVSFGELGVVGWTKYSLDGNSREVYLPLRISQNGNATSSKSYSVVLWPEQELQEVFISVATVKAGGVPDNFIWDGKALGYGYYPKERAITFEIPKPETPGFYYLEIGATIGKGGVVAIEHWFYHAG